MAKKASITSTARSSQQTEIWVQDKASEPVKRLTIEICQQHSRQNLAQRLNRGLGRIVRYQTIRPATALIVNLMIQQRQASQADLLPPVGRELLPVSIIRRRPRPRLDPTSSDR